jgi:hypothetical protein
MSEIGLMMNGLLAVLLLGALGVGWRLEGRLKALKASHQSFSRAVEDLDRAAARAEQGLADLRAATDEAAESLAARIERASHLVHRLERLTAEAEQAEARLLAAPRPEPRTEARPEPRAETPRPEPSRAEGGHERRPTRETAFARFAERYNAQARPSQPQSALVEAAARNDLILEDEVEAPSPRMAPEVVARFERLRALARPRPAAAPAPQKSAADDDLFDAPAPLRRAAGGFR